MAVFLFCLGLISSAVAAQSRRDEMAVMDSLRTIQPRFRASWLRQRGLGSHDGGQISSADSLGLHIVGRWSFGPAYDVDCRMTPAETLIALGRGSGVSLLRFSRSDTTEFQLLSDINAASVISRVRLVDTTLFVGTGSGVESYRISNEHDPTLLHALLTPLNDFAVRESLLYIMGYDDSFKVYSIADPANPRWLGACRDSGGPVTLAGNTAFVGDQSGLHAIDISNPANPHRVGSWGSSIISAEARGNICCVTEYDPDSVLFFVLDVTNPANMHQLSTLRGAGGDALCIDGQYVYTAGGYGFQILDISDSLDPLIVGRYGLGSYKYGVWGKSGFDRAFVANEANGLAVMNTGDPGNPAPDSFLLAAGYTVDLDVRGRFLYVANEVGGLKILDVLDPTLPTMIGELDSIGAQEWSYSVVTNDSFAFMGWFNTPAFRSVDISDPTHPTFAGSCNPFEEAQDMVLRDSLVYCAENYRFQVVNVARPCEPQVVGTLALQNASLDLFVADSLAYVGNWPSPIINISDPAHPETVGSFPMPLGGVYVRDTFAYLATSYDSMFVYSVANPALPVRLGSLDFAGGQHYAVYNVDIEVVDTIAYIGGTSLKTVSVADPRNPREVGTRWNPPSLAVSRLAYTWPYLYVACSDGGVCIMETLQTGISEPARRPAASRISVTPSLTRGPVRVTVNVTGRAFDLEVFDVTGNLIQRKTGLMRGAQTIDLTSAPDGAYLVMVKTEVGMSTTKVVKTRR